MFVYALFIFVDKFINRMRNLKNTCNTSILSDIQNE